MQDGERSVAGGAENPGTVDRLYAGTLATLLLLELPRLERGSVAMPNATRGGLAAWQVRRVRDFIEDNLTEHVSLARARPLDTPQPHSFLLRL
jgi:hypothetical protein